MRWLPLVLLGVLSCTTPHVYETTHTKIQIDAINLMAVEYFAPEYDPSNPDDFSKKDHELKCDWPGSFYKNLFGPGRGKIMVDCLNSLKDGVAHYSFSYQAKPELVLDPDEEKQPACLKAALPVIPIPREVYFLGRDARTEEWGCYASSFNVRQKKPLDIEFLKKNLRIDIRFPMPRALKGEKDLQLWLLYSTLDLLSHFNQGQKTVRADIVPEQTCGQCFQNDPLFEEKMTHRIPPVVWP